MNYALRLQQLGFEVGSPNTNDDIERIESTIGVRLPTEYRAFLLQCGMSYGDAECSCQEPTPFGDTHGICAFDDAAGVYGLLDSMITPRNMITIGDFHFAKYTCLSVAGIDRGAVYALDGECRAFWTDEEFELRFNAMADEIRDYLQLRRNNQLEQKPAGYDNVYRLADSFDAFLQSLTKIEDD